MSNVTDRNSPSSKSPPSVNITPSPSSKSWETHSPIRNDNSTNWLSSSSPSKWTTRILKVRSVSWTKTQKSYKKDSKTTKEPFFWKKVLWAIIFNTKDRKFCNWKKPITPFRDYVYCWKTHRSIRLSPFPWMIWRTTIFWRISSKEPKETSSSTNPPKVRKFVGVCR